MNNASISLDSIGGIGATILPTPISIGSGDVPKGSGNVKKEQEKQEAERKEILYKFKTFEEFVNEASSTIIDYFSSRNKILVGLKTNLLTNLKDRYDYQEDGDEIYFFNKEDRHFCTMFGVGTRYQELKHDGTIDEYGWPKKQ